MRAAVDADGGAPRWRLATAGAVVAAVVAVLAGWALVARLPAAIDVPPASGNLDAPPLGEWEAWWQQPTVRDAYLHAHTVDPLLIRFLRPALTVAAERRREAGTAPSSHWLVPLAGAALEVEFLAERFGQVGEDVASVTAVDVAPGALAVLRTRTRWPFLRLPCDCDDGDGAAPPTNGSCMCVHVSAPARSLSGATLRLVEDGGTAEHLGAAVLYAEGDVLAGGCAEVASALWAGQRAWRGLRARSEVAEEGDDGVGGGAFAGFDFAWDRRALDAVAPAQRPAYARVLDAAMAARGAVVLLVVHDESRRCDSCARSSGDEEASSNEEGRPPHSISSAEVHRLFGSRRVGEAACVGAANSRPWTVTEMTPSGSGGSSRDAVYLLSR